MGTSLSRSSPRPSAPRLLLPQQKSAPSAATHALPWRDAATETTRRLAAVPDGDSEKRSTRRIGVSNQAARAPSLSNDETRPVRVSNAREPPTPPTPPGKNFAASARDDASPSPKNGDAARGDPPAPSRSRRIRRARSRDFGEEERRSNDPAKCCTSAEAPRVLPSPS